MTTFVNFTTNAVFKVNCRFVNLPFCRLPFHQKAFNTCAISSMGSLQRL